MIRRSAFVVGLAAAVAGCAAEPAKTPQTAPRPAATAPASSAASQAINAPLIPVVVPAEPPNMAAFARRLAMVIDGARPPIRTFPLNVASLPQATIHASLDAKQAAKLDKSKLTEDSDIAVLPAAGYARSYMLSLAFKDLSKITYGRIRMQGTYGPADGWFGDGYGKVMNAYATCGDNFTDVTPVRMESVLVGDNSVKYTVMDGILDRQTCRILTVSRSTAEAKPLLPRGILYGFRACATSCSEGEELTILFPRSSAAAAGALGGNADRAAGSFSKVAFPVQKGGGGAFAARISKRDATQWQLKSAPKDSVTPIPFLADPLTLNAAFSNMEVGVEVSQAQGDESPVGLVYMDVDPESLPPLVPASSPTIFSGTPTTTTPSLFDSRR